MMELPRNDLHLTTTGVGHAFRTGQPFPPPNIQVLHAIKTAIQYNSSVLLQLTSDQPLPERLGIVSSNPVTVQDVYNTGYSIAHDYKPKGTIVDEPECKKAPGHWNISYLSNHINKVGSIYICMCVLIPALVCI